MASININISEEERDIIAEVASFHDLSMTDLAKAALFSRIEDELDLQLAVKNHKKYLKKPKSYSLDKLRKEFDL